MLARCLLGGVVLAEMVEPGGSWSAFEHRGDGCGRGFTNGESPEISGHTLVEGHRQGRCQAEREDTVCESASALASGPGGGHPAGGR